MKIAYRPDIDGLRAVAVIAILIFHFDESWLPGSFVGVDLFFVISGFLITSLIVAERSAGTFSFSGFYARRVRRIVPALAVVVVATLIAGHFLLTPNHLQELANSAIAAMLFVANVFFAYGVDTGYFADDASSKPLLHLWSLGVEEQFYLLWPLAVGALLAVRLSTQGKFVTALIATALALALSEWLTRFPIFAFYMLPSRAFELLIGATIALAPAALLGRIPKVAAEALGIVGLILIGVSLSQVRGGMPFPGFTALPAALGTGFVIVAGMQDTFSKRALSLKPMIGIGLISYSLYLWHWPVLAFARYVYIDLNPLSVALLALLIFALSIATYVGIERPCRRMSLTPRQVFGRQLALPALGIVLLSSALLSSGGLGLYAASPSFATASAPHLDTAPATRFDYVCQGDQLDRQDTINPRCVQNEGAGGPPVLLWGDSMAAHFIGIIGSIAKAEGFALRNIAHSACPPLLEAPERFVAAAYRTHCERSSRIVWQILADHGTIILSAAWRMYGQHGQPFWDELASTVKTLAANHRVVLVGEAPRFKGYDWRCTEKALKVRWLDCASAFSYEDRGTYPTNLRLAELAAKTPNVSYIDFRSLICPQGVCSPYDDDGPLYYDSAHLSMAGSWRLGERAVANKLCLLQCPKVLSSPMASGATDQAGASEAR